MLLDGGKKSSYVCSAKLAKRLPLWSNAKHCAECPPLGRINAQLFDETAQFGLIDETAAAYFDFWSKRQQLPPFSTQALFQSLHDVNGPFNESCSASRATDAFGRAG